MKIVTVRRISQIFFFSLFVWLCITASIGSKFWQLRDWPVNLFLQLDPLIAIGTILSTGTIYRSLLLSLVTVVLTIILGRFFCSWVCPFGTIHHFFSYLSYKSKKAPQKIMLNKYRRAQSIKYFVLIFFLAMAAFPSLAATLQTGLLDPIPLVSRSFSLILLPVSDRPVGFVSVIARFYQLAWIIFAVFLAAVLLNFFIPRFYCRFICPLGALFAIFSRFAIWRIGKKESVCSNCKACELSCQGGCEPSEKIKIAECILCFNCREACRSRDNVIRYQTVKSLAGEDTNPDISRRGFVLSIASGILSVPALRLSGILSRNWYYKLIRPPGALAEPEFLKRCIKCGQCMRVCPTNVIQPAGLEGGIESLWTPILNNRTGTSGCQLNCVACGQICPTSAIRPITLSEKLGRDEFASKGPIKLGTAFVDRNRCLPWAMNKPCIVCEENCPVSPKAIYTDEIFNTIRDGVFTVKNVEGDTIEIEKALLTLDKFATGDYYILMGGRRKEIRANTENSFTIAGAEDIKEIIVPGSKLEIQVRLQRPYIDIEKCIGCGVCEHECPVSGKKAVRVSAEGETRSFDRKLYLET